MDAGGTRPPSDGASTTGGAKSLPLPPDAELDALTAQLCGRDRRCCRDSAESGGPDRAGRDMTVLRLDRSCGKKARRTEDECHPYQNWLVVHEGATLLSRQLLTVECNDGYGAKGVGEDSVETSRNTFSHHRSGGSNWGWTSSATIVLDPLHVASINSLDAWGNGSDTCRWEKWSWDEFRGKGERSVPLCKERAPESATRIEPGAVVPEAGGIQTEYVLIPHVSLPAAYANRGWMQTALGACSVMVDGNAAGFTMYGTPSDAADSSFRVVATTEGERLVLFVEVVDDRWVGPGQATAGKKWLHDDHLELWLGERVSWEPDCTSKEQNSARQWAVRISDGRVFAAMGDAEELPEVQRVFPTGATGLARLKIKLPASQGDAESGITLVYSDSDDGKRQKRLIATSKVRRGWDATLGAMRESKKDEANCKVGESGRLEPVLKPPRRKPSEPLFSFELG
jgi:hypothetical protein